MLCASPPLAIVAVPDRASDFLLASTWRFIAHNLVRGLQHGILLFLAIYLLERYYHARTSQYKSRNFIHDICYWFYGRSDLARILFTASWFSFLGGHLAFLQLQSLQAVPAVIRWTASFVVVDFVTYWIHRWQHSQPLLWAFHSVHHSQEQLSFATSARVHPVDNFVLTTLAFGPILLFGQTAETVLPVYLGMEFVIAIQHSEIPWRFGPLYRVFVSPAFHSFHHSIQQEHHNQNFGRLLSIWDYLFGTAVPDQSRPLIYGLQDLRMPTLTSQLCSPFVRAYRDIAGSSQPAQASQDFTRSDSV